MTNLDELKARLSFASDAVEKLIALVRAEALEEAAKVAEIGWFNSEFCAAAIRALKEKSST